MRSFYLFIILTISSACFAGIDFSLGDKVRVLSDKGYRYTSENKFIAEGNVIIVSDENTLYGNKAQIFLDEQRFVIEDDIKLVNPEFSLLGESFNFLSSSQKLELRRAVIITDNYKVVGEKVSRVGKGDILLKNATYTTCKDCPNSWSFKGEKIFVTPGSYVRIKGAYFVVNGVNVLYLPFFFFPIKRERESGVLFPKLSVNLNDGTFFQVPYFQTLGESADVTITPTLWGVWGLGGELEFRKAFSNRNIIHFESKFLQEYQGNEKVHVSSLDISLWTKDERLSFTAKLDVSNDFNSLRRFERYVDQSYSRPDFGGEFRFGYTGGGLEANLIASNRSNLFTPATKGTDSSYVQILPELNFNLVRKKILNSKYLPKISTSFDFKFSQFRQNEFNQQIFSRNADRFIGIGAFDINYSQLLSVGRLKSEHIIRYSNYNLKYVDERHDLEKKEIFHYLNYELPLSKTYGKAEFIVNNDLDLSIKNEQTSSETFVTNDSSNLFHVNKIDSESSRDFTTAYIHKASFNFNFYHLGNFSASGKPEVLQQFMNQNLSPNTPGLFDYNDSVFSFENGIQANSTLSSLQTTNTLELLLVNNLYKKEPEENKTGVHHLASFRISQGALIKNKYIPESKLSRLLVGASTSLFGYNLDFTDSYFHDSNEHLLNFALTKNFGFASINGQLIYDSRTVPYNKILNSQIGLLINPEIKVLYRFSYDISVSELNFEDYSVRYLPSNDCWFLEFNYYTDKIQSRYSFNFMLNLNEEQFKQNASL